MKETIKSIIEWSEQTFPDATLDGQLRKFEDEWDEFFAENDHNKKIIELADVFIVAFSICRFDLAEGVLHIAEAMRLFGETPYSLYRLEEAIRKKMETNRSRVWEKKDGQYQHAKK